MQFVIKTPAIQNAREFGSKNFKSSLCPWAVKHIQPSCYFNDKKRAEGGIYVVITKFILGKIHLGEYI